MKLIYLSILLLCFSFSLAQPSVSFSPEAISLEATTTEEISVDITITNMGDSDLSWSVEPSGDLTYQLSNTQGTLGPLSLETISLTQNPNAIPSVYHFLEFDGGEWVDIGNSEDFNIETGNLVVEAWIYPWDANQNARIVSKGDGNTSGTYQLNIEDSRLRITFGDGDINIYSDYNVIESDV